MREKLQLVLVMSRDADLYLLDEPMSGVDPVTRDEILDTILTGYRPGSTLLLSTHLIQDVERILDQVIFLDKGKAVLQEDADALRQRTGLSISEAFKKEHAGMKRMKYELTYLGRALLPLYLATLAAAAACRLMGPDATGWMQLLQRGIGVLTMILVAASLLLTILASWNSFSGTTSSRKPRCCTACLYPGHVSG